MLENSTTILNKSEDQTFINVKIELEISNKIIVQ